MRGDDTKTETLQFKVTEQERKLIERHDNGLVLTGTGRTMFIETLSVSKAFEDDLLDNFPASEIAEMKHVLKRIIQLTGNNIPELWN